LTKNSLRVCLRSSKIDTQALFMFRPVGLGSSDDEAIWSYAKANGFSIISKDSDFAERSALFGAPPSGLLKNWS